MVESRHVGINRVLVGLNPISGASFPFLWRKEVTGALPIRDP
jgi:hypothetical protein